jgi:hypothetical protein
MSREVAAPAVKLKGLAPLHELADCRHHRFGPLPGQEMARIRDADNFEIVDEHVQPVELDRQ